MKKSDEIEIGSIVVTPLSDDSGEMAYVYGKLIDINSRFAKIKTDDGIIRVGKSKIELVKPPRGKTTGGKKKAQRKAKEKGEDTKERIAVDYDYAKVKAASGRVSCDNGDAVAAELRGKNLAEAYVIISKAIGVPLVELKARYAHLNPGQQRMCIGNRLRGFYRNKK